MGHVASTTTHLEAGELRADFLPGLGMLGSSLRHRGRELLRRVQDLPGAAARGSTAGIPLLHPWANRLPGAGYQVAGRAVTLDLRSPLLHLDGRGLPMHGVPWSQLAWEVTAAGRDRLAASLAWDRPDLLAVFPFRHRLELVVTLGPGDLTLETTLHAGPEGPVPASFGFHPYLGIPNLPRQAWHLQAPEMRRLVLDAAACRQVTRCPTRATTGRSAARCSTTGSPCSTGQPPFRSPEPGGASPSISWRATGTRRSMRRRTRTSSRWSP